MRQLFKQERTAASFVCDRFDERLARHLRSGKQRARQFARFAAGQRTNKNFATRVGAGLRQELFQKRLLFDVFRAKAGDEQKRRGIRRSQQILNQKNAIGRNEARCLLRLSTTPSRAL